MNQRRVPEQQQGNTQMLKELDALQAHVAELETKFSTARYLLRAVILVRESLVDADTDAEIDALTELDTVTDQAKVFLERGCLPPGLVRAAPAKEQQP